MADIPQLILQLDHPDIQTQQAAADALVELGRDDLDIIVANLEFATPRARRALMGVISRIGSPRALLPLMRFVWDKRESIEDADARALAMKAISELARPEDGARLFSFLMDISDDADPFVRGWTAHTLGNLGDPRARSFLKQSLTDPSDVVRERAQAALQTLRTGASDALKPEVDDTELLNKIRGSRGPQQTYWYEELCSRPNAVALATRLVRERGRGMLLGLQYLLESRDPVGRTVAIQLLMGEDSATHRAIALRLLAIHLNGDADSEEREVVRSALYDTDSFVRVAATQCAGASGDDDLTNRALSALRDPDVDVVLAAAVGLSIGLSAKDRHRFPALDAAFDTVHRQRLKEPTESIARAEAYLLRAIGKISTGPQGSGSIQKIGLRALFDAENFRPILVTALDLLDAATPADLPDAARWEPEQVRSLALLLSSSDREVRHRALDLVVRGAARGNDAITPMIQKMVFEDDDIVVNGVIPALELAASARARETLDQLALSDTMEVSVAAQAAALRLRNSSEWIDAEFDDVF